ncbi:MAG: Xaa-Pro peptidase family protein [Kiritimatiellae bacterium]|nr:Xaa-Pro peptidase family protein [Kiritimatiellia bacterium]
MSNDSAGPARSFPPAEYAARIRALLAALRRQRLDGALIAGEIARLYYTGIETSNGLLWVDAREGPVFFTDFRYIFAARRALPFMSCALLKRGPESERAMRRRAAAWRRCGYEGSQPAAAFARRKGLLERVSDWVDVDDLIGAQRAVKSPREQQAMRRALAANDGLLSVLLPQLHAGLSEWEIRGLLRREADRLGQGEAFDCIVCVGANAAECHHRPGRDKLWPNQPLLLDFGVRLDHYCADLTRCVVFGRPSPLFRELHRIVLAANRRAVRAIRPGMTGAEVDAVARRHIEKAGYGRAFGHGLGHGLGLEVHEAPSFAASCKTEIRPGMTITVEPGIYLPGRAGVRIEDVVLITRTGCEVLTHAPHWIER